MRSHTSCLWFEGKLLNEMSNAPDLLSHSSDSFFHIGYSAPKGSFNPQCLQLSCSVVPHIPQQHLPKPSSPPSVWHHYSCLLSLAGTLTQRNWQACRFLPRLPGFSVLPQHIFYILYPGFSYSTNQMEPLECSLADYVILVPSGPVLSRVILRDWSSDQTCIAWSTEKNLNTAKINFHYSKK